jgi:cystathionine beta-lyase/cystathionine gamma-synthase
VARGERRPGVNGTRGIRTLSARVHQQSATADRLARFLEDHPKVVRVSYPGLDSHLQREVAKRQMSLGGTILTVEVAGGMDGGKRFAEGCEIAQIALSLGGPETLLTHPATIVSHLTPDERAEMGIADGMVRVSVGLEHVDDLIADLAQSLDRLP